MSDKDHIHPLAWEVLENRKNLPNSIAEVNEGLRKQYAWKDQGCPVLTTHTQAVLKAVESVKADICENKPCDECEWLIHDLQEDLSQCPFMAVRQAMEDHE